MSNDVKLSSPWVEYYRKVESMFKDDPEIHIMYDEDNGPSLKLYVDSASKASALSELLPTEKEFGNVTLQISIVPANPLETKLDLLTEAFRGNPAFSFIKTVTLFAKPVTYFVFKNKVVQYYLDNLADINGNKSTLYQDLALDIFGEQDSIFFCTDVPKPDDVDIVYRDIRDKYVDNIEKVSK